MRLAVSLRADNACEYCRAAAELYNVSFHVEHIVARKHDGQTELENLAYACHLCNRYKGPNLSGIDPETNRLVRLFHPRNDDWQEHFKVENGYIFGLTPIGRATVHVLNMNMPERIRTRIVAGIPHPKN